jgi:hypothetical protein
MLRRKADELRLAQQATNILREEIAGHTELASRLKEQYDLQNKILEAQRAGHAETVKELQTQLEMVKAANARADAEAATAKAQKAQSDYNDKWKTGLQDFADNAGTLNEEQVLLAAASDPYAKLRDSYGDSFGSHGPGFGPTMAEQLRAGGFGKSYVPSHIYTTGELRQLGAGSSPSLSEILEELRAIREHAAMTNHKLTPRPGDF